MRQKLYPEATSATGDCLLLGDFLKHRIDLNAARRDYDLRCSRTRSVYEQTFATVHSLMLHGFGYDEEECATFAHMRATKASEKAAENERIARDALNEAIYNAERYFLKGGSQ